MINSNTSSLSLRQRIYISFFLLVLLFVINAIISILTLYQNNHLSKNITTVIEPSLKGMEDFEDLLVESKMYTTNWVFLRASEEDKAELIALHANKYPVLKTHLLELVSKWDNHQMADSLIQILSDFEKMLVTEKQIMNSLQKFEDYDDPAIKLNSETLVEEQIHPQTTALQTALNKLVAQQQFYKAEKHSLLKRSSSSLTTLLTILSLLIVGLGIFLSLYMTRVIIKPIYKISEIINDLGKGITRNIRHENTEDEIGNMVVSVNNLSDKIRATARFATQIGAGNFDEKFEPLSEDDSLGIALLAMRDNIKISSTNLNEAQHLAQVGNWERIMATNEMRVSKEFLNIFGIKEKTIAFHYERMLEFIHLHDLEYVKDINVRNQFTVPKPYECRIITPEGKLKHIYVQTKIVLDETGNPVKAFGIVQDITRRKMDEELLRQSENSLEKKNKELLIKNKELEQFAYVASHDLQEPLKTTASFVNLLHRKYKGQLDKRADEYLHYISKASERMQALIKDLLDYSLIGSKTHVQKINCNEVVEAVTENLQRCIKESKAVIRYMPLPTINGYETEIRDLFQHLMSNAIKFRKKDVAPVIRIGAINHESHWEFYISDNGIGIDAQYMDRIFVIFQRLHNRTEYEGSGIGLSHCRKIVELHNGKIWLESTIAEGTTFYFTIMKDAGSALANTNLTSESVKQ